MIIPAIDLINGQVVRLYQGDYAQQTDFNIDPLSQLQHYQNQGAQLLHIVDLDGAKDPNQRQVALIGELVKQLDCPVQVGGGIRNQQQVEQLFDVGVARVVIGSLAVKQPQLVQQLMQQYGAEKICLALDININSAGEYIVAVAGWQQAGDQTLHDLVAQFRPYGLKYALVTDISRDGTMQGANWQLYQDLATQYPDITWQASGGVASLEHVAQVKASGANAIIIGKALLTQEFTVTEAIACWPNESSPA